MSLVAIRRQFRQMNGDVIAIVYAEPERRTEAEAALANLVRFFDEVERRFSRFLPDSELSALNAAAGSWFASSTALFRVVELALSYSEATGGIFDPTILRALEAAGYDRSFEQVRDQPSVSVGTIPPANYRDIRLDRAREAIWLPPRVGIDLGGIVKGWAVDGGAGILQRFGNRAVSAGGDMAVRGAPPGRDHWLIGVENPAQPEIDLLQLRVRDGGVATSGTRRRHWLRAGNLQHHLIDPTQQRPADLDLTAVTVVASTATEADVLAKVVFLLGRERGAAYLEGRTDAAGVLVGQDGWVHVTSRLRASVVQAGEL